MQFFNSPSSRRFAIVLSGLSIFCGLITDFMGSADIVSQVLPGLIIGFLPLIAIGGTSFCAVALIAAVWTSLRDRYVSRRNNRRDTLMEAYKKLRDACFPETLNPDVQGNPEAIQAYAVEFVNLKLFPVLKKSERLDRCTREPSSMSSWFRHIEDIQMGE